MKMVRFGADQILSGKGGTYTDEDIDALIARGEERTSEFEAKLKTDAQHNLANFQLLGEDETGTDTFSFGGKNYREGDRKGGNFINLPQRQRKRNYDVNEYFRETMNSGGPTGGMKAHAADAASKKRKKGPALHDFQLFDRERLNAIAEKERRLAAQKEEQIRTIGELRSRAHQTEESLKTAEEMEKGLVNGFKLSDEDLALKTRLQAEGFPDWSKKDFKAFCSSLERHGRYNFKSVAHDMVNDTGKDMKEIQRYFVAFWTNYRRVADWKKVLEKIERGERKIVRLRQIRDAIQEKVERHLEDTFGSEFQNQGVEIPSANELLEYSWPKMTINYGTGTRGRAYQEEEDAFLICMMHRHGYGAAERIRLEIRRAWQFRFDWYFKSRSAQEIQKRCDTIVKIIEKENEEVRKKETEKTGSAEDEGNAESKLSDVDVDTTKVDSAAVPVDPTNVEPVALPVGSTKVEPVAMPVEATTVEPAAVPEPTKQETVATPAAGLGSDAVMETS